MTKWLKEIIVILINTTEEKDTTIRRYSFKGLGNITKLLSLKIINGKNKENNLLDIE